MELTIDIAERILASKYSVTITDRTVVQLSGTDLSGINGSSEGVFYVGKLVIAGATSATKLAVRRSASDTVTFDNTDIVALGTGVTGSFPAVIFNKVSSMSTTVGSNYFIGYKITTI